MRFLELRCAIHESVIQTRFPFHQETINHFTNMTNAKSILKSGVLKAKNVPGYEMDDDEETAFISFTEKHFWDEPERAFYMRSFSLPVVIAFNKKKVETAGVEEVKYNRDWFDNHISAIPYILDSPIFTQDAYDEAEEELRQEDDEDDFEVDMSDLEEHILKKAYRDFKLAKDEGEWIKEGDLKFSWDDVAYVSARGKENIAALKAAFPKHADKIVSYTVKEAASSLVESKANYAIGKEEQGTVKKWSGTLYHGTDDFLFFHGTKKKKAVRGQHDLKSLGQAFSTTPDFGIARHFGVKGMIIEFGVSDLPVFFVPKGSYSQDKVDIPSSIEALALPMKTELNGKRYYEKEITFLDPFSDSLVVKAIHLPVMSKYMERYPVDNAQVRKRGGENAYLVPWLNEIFGNGFDQFLKAHGYRGYLKYGDYKHINRYRFWIQFGKVVVYPISPDILPYFIVLDENQSFDQPAMFQGRMTEGKVKWKSLKDYTKAQKSSS